MQVVIYQNDAGGVAVLHPAPEALAIYGIDAIARKDVPAGRPYKIIDAADLPTDYMYSAAWTVDAAELTDGVGADSNEFPSEGA